MSHGMYGGLNLSRRVNLIWLKMLVVIGGVLPVLCVSAGGAVVSSDHAAILETLNRAYGIAVHSEAVASVEIGWKVSFRDDFSRLGNSLEALGSTDSNPEIEREDGTSWIRMEGDWRRESASITKLLGPRDLKVHVTLASRDFFIESRTKRAEIVTLRYQTDDRIGKRWLSPTTIMSPGFVARLLISELSQRNDYRFEKKNGLLCVRSSVPEDFDIDIDEQSGAISRVVTRMSPEVLLRVRYSGSLGSALYPAPQPEEMLLEVESRTDKDALTCSRFKFSRALFAEVSAERFHWSDIAPLAHWQGSESVIGKDGLIDEAASARLVAHNAALAKPVAPQFLNSTSGPPTLIDRTVAWRTWFLAAGITLIVSACVTVLRRKWTFPAG
ncbi:MAG: hypothetical protein JNK16_08300 [Phycisphaerales bacterium]|nr:hypothetical protein [Phycisphaerales bacterium]